jgi:hypothetical protein
MAAITALIHAHTVKIGAGVGGWEVLCRYRIDWLHSPGCCDSRGAAHQ